MPVEPSGHHRVHTAPSRYGWQQQWPGEGTARVLWKVETQDLGYLSTAPRRALTAGSLCKPWPAPRLAVTVSAVIPHRPAFSGALDASALLQTAAACKASVANFGQALVGEMAEAMCLDSG